jgi:hypothetical protein
MRKLVVHWEPVNNSFLQVRHLFCPTVAGEHPNLIAKVATGIISAEASTLYLYMRKALLDARE